jgi:isoleucyl-tRNA synthetase
MTDYKHTLNLPHTDFAMKANLAEREPARLKNWQTTQVYQQIRQAHADSPSFVLHDGPPYANGHLHCGHALNKILKDMIIKAKSFSGFNAPFVPGWDCHGLPIELNVEKKVGKAGVKLDNKAFRAHCREYAASQMAIQREEFERLGVLADWEHPYTTMQPAYEASIVRALAQIIANGHLHKGFKPVHWCLDCGSALAEAEVDYEDKTSHSIDVGFKAQDPAAYLVRIGSDLPLKPLTVPIWTTTPWTLPANEAVALHPEITYDVVDTGTDYYLIATDLVATAMARYGHTAWFSVGQASGQVFEHLTVTHPLVGNSVPLVLSTHVTTDSGTGCVHIAPAHGPDDYAVGLTYQLPCINPVLANGCYADWVTDFAGLFVRRADTPVLNTLRERGVLLCATEIQHSYPHCWRHKTPVIFRATPQWFIAMDQQALRAQMLAQIEQVEWVPAWGKARIAGMVADRPDWCISRQRVWGTPMCLFVHRETQALHPNTVALMHEIANRIELEGLEAWFELNPDELLGEDAAHYDKILDTLDVWFDSGVSHAAVLGFGRPHHPAADLYLEGSDQHRGWFNSSLTTAVAMTGHAPYKKVLTHGYTVDAQGKKLSKSKGNYVALDDVIRQHGADVLRLWVSSTDYRNEVSISPEILQRAGDAYRRIRNTARFLLSNLFDFDPSAGHIESTQLVELDRWVLTRCQQLQTEIIAAYDEFQFHVVYQKIHHFCAIELSSFYLDIIKDRQYTAPEHSAARRSCQFAMYHLLQALVRWIAPILSFTADEIFESLPGKPAQSIFLESWYRDFPQYEEVDMYAWSSIQLLRDEINKALETQRQAGVIGSGLAAEVVIYASDTVYPILQRLHNELRFILITSKAQVLPVNECPADLVWHDNLGIAIAITPSHDPKCVRCWHRSADIGQNPAHPELCARCTGNIGDHPEERIYA